MTDTPISADTVRDFFAAVLAQDPVVLARIDAAAGAVELLEAGFVFSLPALHALIDAQASLEYGQFRQLLYNSSLNEELGAFDAEVIPHRTTGKVDTSLYCLRSRPLP